CCISPQHFTTSPSAVTACSSACWADGKAAASRTCVVQEGPSGGHILHATRNVRHPRRPGMRPSTAVPVPPPPPGAPPPPASPSQWGRFPLQPRETQMIRIDPSAVQLRVCNDATSKGLIAVTVGGNDTRLLRPGLCAEDIGDRILASNEGDG